jgi:ferredoxin
MRITVDAWKCQSHLNCVSAVPKLFTFDEEHSYAVAIDGSVPSDLEAEARRAISLCPEGAISIQDEGAPTDG